MVSRSRRRVAPRSGASGTKKAAGDGRPPALSELPRRSALLDGRKLPGAAAVAAEGPEFRRFDDPIGVAGYDSARRLLGRDVGVGEAHRHRGVRGVALAPRLGEVALFEAHTGNGVDEA